MSNKKENGKTDVNVDMRNGKLKFEVSIFSLTTAAGAAFNILLKYDSSAMPYVYETWNREVNTGLLGSGWSLNIEDNIFAVVDGADLRYFLAFKGMKPCIRILGLQQNIQVEVFHGLTIGLF